MTCWLLVMSEKAEKRLEEINFVSDYDFQSHTMQDHVRYVQLKLSFAFYFRKTKNLFFFAMSKMSQTEDVNSLTTIRILFSKILFEPMNQKVFFN